MLVAEEKPDLLSPKFFDYPVKFRALSQSTDSHFALHSPLETQLKKVMAAPSLGLVIAKPLQGRERIWTMRDPDMNW